MNRVILIGRTTTNIELNTTSSGVAWVRFTLAVTRRSQSRNEITDFIPIVAFSHSAILLKNSVPKGTLIAVEGNLQSSSYQSRTSNQTIRSLDVHLDTFYFLESKRVTDERAKNRSSDDFIGTSPFTGTSSYPKNTYSPEKVEPISSQSFSPNPVVEEYPNKKPIEEKLHDLGDLESDVNDDIDIF
ncbi:single-stranded DNA-binding protein [Mycoplasma sp. 394]